jgi:hypothetical protein
MPSVLFDRRFAIRSLYMIATAPLRLFTKKRAKLARKLGPLNANALVGLGGIPRLR